MTEPTVTQPPRHEETRVERDPTAGTSTSEATPPPKADKPKDTATEKIKAAARKVTTKAAPRKKLPRGQSPAALAAEIVETGKPTVTNYSITTSGRAEKVITDELVEAWRDFILELRKLGFTVSGGLNCDDGHGGGLSLSSGNVTEEDDD